MPDYLGRPTIATIDLAALGSNLLSIKQFLGSELKYLAVVKANAYGHGSVECARRLVEVRADWLGVASAEESVELREAGIDTPILCFSGFWPGHESVVLEHDITPVI